MAPPPSWQASLIFAIIAVALVAGCVQSPSGPPIVNLTGRWTGGATWRANVESPPCAYEGDMQLILTQSGADIAGSLATFVREVTPLSSNASPVPCDRPGTLYRAPITGTVNASEIRFTTGSPPTRFAGTLENGQLRGTFESCSGRACPSGSQAVGAVGDFSFTKQASP